MIIKNHIIKKNEKKNEAIVAGVVFSFSFEIFFYYFQGI
jgi:glycopeptide antibiotics resistance protein